MLRRRPSTDPIEVDGLFVTVQRSDRARRIRLLVDSQGARVVLPRWASRKDAVGAVSRHGAWIKKHISRVAQKIEDSVSDGSVLVEGRRLQIVHDSSARPTVLMSGNNLHLGGEDAAACLENWLRALASCRINDAVRARSSEMGLTPNRVSIRDQKTKWGACTSRGTVTLNWRLVMAPPEVLDYVVVHELAHLRELNHSARFWAIVERHCPDWRAHRAWLKKHGQSMILPVLS